MFLKDGYEGSIPFERLPEKQQDRIKARLNWDAPVYESVEAFLEGSVEKPIRRLLNTENR